MNQTSITLCEDPYVGIYENVFSTEDCQKLIELATPQLHTACVQGGVVADHRKSDIAWLYHHSHPSVFELGERIASIVKQPLSHAEAFQIAKYGVGGKFDAHFDVYNIAIDGCRHMVEQFGQRTVTAIIYLNNVTKGGNTYFPSLNLDIEPEEGKLLIFENLKKGTTEHHPLSMHGGREVEEGEKWIATLWFCEKPHY